MLVVSMNYRAFEDALAVQKMRRIDADIASGKIKVLTEKQALGKYTRELKI